MEEIFRTVLEDASRALRGTADGAELLADASTTSSSNDEVASTHAIIAELDEATASKNLPTPEYHLYSSKNENEEMDDMMEVLRDNVADTLLTSQDFGFPNGLGTDEFNRFLAELAGDNWLETNGATDVGYETSTSVGQVHINIDTVETISCLISDA
jgi:hypothetical protein